MPTTNLKNFLQKISSLPMIGKVLSIICIVIALVVVLFFSTACGSPRATVRVTNRADSTQTTISVSTGDGGSTTVSVAPNLFLDSSKNQQNEQTPTF